MSYLVQQVEDSFTLLKEMEEDAVDVIITDPPYSEHCQNNMCSGSIVGKKVVPKYESEFEPLKEYSWLHDAIRVANRWVIVFCTLEDFGRFEMTVGREAYVRSAIWYKSNAMGQLTADRPANAYEGVAILHKPKARGRPRKHWNGRGSYGIWKCNSTRGLVGRHPNEKPMELCTKLVGLFSDPGELVFDPFAGSGAIGEACLRLGRCYLGWERDPTWAAKARARVTRAIYAPVSVAGLREICSMR